MIRHTAGLANWHCGATVMGPVRVVLNNRVVGQPWCNQFVMVCSAGAGFGTGVAYSLVAGTAKGSPLSGAVSSGFVFAAFQTVIHQVQLGNPPAPARMHARMGPFTLAVPKFLY